MAQTSKPMIRIHNTEIDEIIDREMTDLEYADYLETISQGEARRAAEEAKAQTKADLLARLGITQEEANLLLNS
jgi:hypothetical protein